MTILITGATGLVGHKLVALLKKDNHIIHYFTTSKSKIKDNPNFKGFYWNPVSGEIDVAAFENVETIIHLAGASIAKKWTSDYKKEILDSRILSANLIFDTLNSIPHNVSRFISASAVGIYPHDFRYVYHETFQQVDQSFLGDVVKQWEESANKFRQLKIIVSVVRIGIVFDSNSGALPQFVKPIKYGLGAAFGSGDQILSWIHIDDLVAIFKHILDNNLRGVYNAVSPYPISNEKLTKAISKVLRKPYFLPNIPSFILRILLGEMSMLLITSQWVSCRKILDTGFQFNHASLEKSLIHLLK